ncbi:MAG: EamA family transporter [Desulfocurvibacter africanus]
MQLKGYFYIILAAVLWALIGPVSRYAFEAGMPPLEVAFWRSCLAWVFFASQARALGQMRVARNDLPAVLAFGVVGIAGLFGSYALAVRAGGAALASVLLYTAPAWVAVMSRLWLGERLSTPKIAAVVLTIVGVAGISLGPDWSGGKSFGVAAILFGLLSGITYALYYIFGKRYLGRYSTPTLFLYALPVGALVVSPFFRFEAHPLQAWVAVAVLAFVSTYLAYSIYYAGLKHLEATRASVVATLEPLVASLLAFFLWDETFTPLGYIGAALILSAVLLTVVDGARRRRIAAMPSRAGA